MTHPAADVCTPKEREALDLYNRGLSERAIALALDVSRSAIRSRLENARRKIAQAKRDTEAA